MTSRQIFEALLIESNKVKAPSLLLEDYNYFVNKAINQYINKVYNAYEVNQQKSDDLRVLKGTTVLTPKLQVSYPTITGTSPKISDSKLFGSTYEVDLPDDYLHILNCIAEYTVKKQFKCYDAGSYVHFGVNRLTSDMFSQIINNYYMRPSYKLPYYFINNVNNSNTFPTIDNQIDVTSTATDISGSAPLILNKGIYKIKTEGKPLISYYKVDNVIARSVINGTVTIVPSSQGLDPTPVTMTVPANFITAGIIVGSFISAEPSVLGPDQYLAKVTAITGNILTLDLYCDEMNTSFTGNIYFYNGLVDITESYVDTDNEKIAKLRYGNKSKVRMEIRYGKDNKVFELSQIYVDYLKAPQFIRLTQDQVDEVEDTSQIIEFPDYVVQEIINELSNIVMENGSDPRLQTHIPVNQSIANPQQEQAK